MLETVRQAQKVSWRVRMPLPVRSSGQQAVRRRGGSEVAVAASPSFQYSGGPEKTHIETTGTKKNNCASIDFGSSSLISLVVPRSLFQKWAKGRAEIFLHISRIGVP